jgi:hypothetical protein
MKLDIKGKRGQPALRYLRTNESRERIQKIYLRFGRNPFTIRTLKAEALPDTRSGEICKWDSTRVIECVGKTQRSKHDSSVKIWRLSETVIGIMSNQPEGVI